MISSDTRKRQRRQAAGALVSNIMMGGVGAGGIGIGGRKSTAQPRPPIKIPPRGIGPVHEPNINDVLCGRGGRINAHAGNVQFRELVVERKKDYLSDKTKKLEKAHIAAAIVRQIRELDPPGRFLKEDPDGSWFDIGDAKAIKKVGQALREDAPDIRDELKTNSDEDVSAEEESTAVAVAPPVIISNRGGAKAATKSPPANSMERSHNNNGNHNQHTNGYYSTKPHQFPGFQPPQSYRPVVPNTTNNNNNNNNGRGSVKGGRSPAFSGAAAAAMKQDDGGYFVVPPPSRDIAFGRTFHPAAEVAESSSIMSGLSGPTTLLSGMSGISALTDPSALGGRSNTQAQAMRISQLHALRQQWAQQHYGGSSSIPNSDSLSRQLIHNSQMGFSTTQHLTDVSWANHSLTGGGVRDDSVIAGGGGVGGGSGSLLSGNYSTTMQSVAMNSLATPNSLYSAFHGTRSVGSNSSSTPRNHNHNHTNMSITSAQSSSLPSMHGSIMSDLSENLIALDLAEPKLLLDQL